MKNLNIKKAREGLIKKEFSAVELAKFYLNKIKKENKKYNDFISLTEDLALKQAKKVDKKTANYEKLGPLEGVPIAIKDNILVEDYKTTAGSKILENYIAPYDATVIKKLKNAGAIILGKTNLDEFAMGSSTEQSAFGPVKNPIDVSRVPGGSSGGSAAAVAADHCVASLGSDTSGSIRQPASFCGIVGFQPSYGMVSRYGLIAMASSLDQIGPLGKTVEDVKLVFDTIRGKDEMDSTTVSNSDYELQVTSCDKLTIGVPKEYFGKGINSKVKEVVKKAIKDFQKLGAEIIDISLPHTDYAIATYYILMPAEVSANLARYDGVKYGYRAKTDNLLDSYLKTRAQGLGDEPRRRSMLGTYVLSAGYRDAYYNKAQKVRALIKQDFDKAFNKVNFILTPTSATTAFKIGEKSDPLSMYMSDIYVAPAALAGLPTVSVPCGEVENLPVGLQIIGSQFQDNLVLEVAKMYEEIEK